MHRLLSIMLTALFVCQTVCITLCIHTHEVDGKLITHSHPYSGTSHQHSDSSFAAFGSIQHSLFAASQQQNIPDARFYLIAVVDSFVDIAYTPIHIASQASRAPPVC